jgi:hypothetical protein
LDRIILSYKKGAVLALNGEWGTGKTTFVEMWGKTLQNMDYPVVYYNAWENDYSEEPLFSMIKSLRSLSADKSSFDKVVEKAGKFIVGALFGAAKSASGLWGNIASAAFKGGIEKLEKDCIDSMKSKEDTSSMINAFKDALSEYLSSCEQNIPLVYFVDELDRCNPTFAVKVLERIKHLFDVPNVVFVLSIDKKQLAFSINGFFGSERFDSTEYLRRFIDIDYDLPKPDMSRFCKKLFENYGFDEIIEKQFKITVGVRFSILDVIEKYVKYYRMNLRQVEKMFAITRAGIWGLNISKEEDVSLLFFFAYLRLFEIDLYADIDEYRLDLQKVIDRLESIIKDGQQGTILREERFMNTMAYFIILYMEGYSKTGKFVSMDSLIGQNNELMVTFKRFDDTIMKNYFIDYKAKNSNYSWSGLKIEDFKNHISLHERIN